MLVREFALPACVIVKHANPCGVAIGATLEEAYDKALASDPTSAYGGIVVVNREIDDALGAKLADQFVEVLFAPGYSDDALTALEREAEHADPRRPRAPPRRRLAALQARARRPARAGLGLRHRGPRELAGRLRRRRTSAQWGDLVFAWRVCKHVSSNAIVLVQGPRRRSASARAR